MREQLADTSSVYTFVSKTVLYFLVKVKVKVITVQSWTGPEGSRRLGLPDFMPIDT